MFDKLCNNCGLLGHHFKQCNEPILSYGIILYKFDNDINDYKYLLIQRNFTPDFKELIYGKFSLNNYDYIHKLISKLALNEIKYIKEFPHSHLYNMIDKFYNIRKDRLYYQKYHKAFNNFDKLLTGYQNNDNQIIKFDIIVNDIISNNGKFFLEPDWGFPKGRRIHGIGETDLKCAIREVAEETNIEEHNYQIDDSNYVLIENCYGTNNVHYKCKYFIAECEDIIYYIDPNNKNQNSEIRKFGWYTCDQAKNLFRPYHLEKIDIINDLQHKLTTKTEN